MQFKHPELLYALFLLLIPIIIHLFQLRKFKKEAFTNVAFLKEVKQNSRKSSQIKKWLILCTRLLLLGALVIAFAQPFTSKTNSFKAKTETVIYIDNSFSMQAKGSQGELLKRTLQDIISNLPENEKISVLTNNKTFRDTEIKAIKNELLHLEYTSTQLPLQSAYLKCKSLLKKQNTSLKNIVLVSDFQEHKTPFKPETDSLINIHLVKLEPVNTNNVAIDSAYISNNTPTNLQLNVLLKNSGKPIENLPISLFNDDDLMAKTSLSIEKIAETSFSLPANQAIKGKLTINDANLRFDNTLFFNIDNSEKVKVLVINEDDDNFLNRIFTEDEFKLTSTALEALSYNKIDQQNLIVLNELNSIPNPLISALTHFTDEGGSIIIIPSASINMQSYNQLLKNYHSKFETLITSEKRITTINYTHPLYNKGVFEKQVSNFQYPKTQSFYNVSSPKSSHILSFEDGKPCLFNTNKVHVFTTALNSVNSNFKNWNVIVPTFYNIAKQSFKSPELYYSIGTNNSFEIETQLQQDAILTLVNNGTSVIPRQKYFNNKVVVNTLESPSYAGVYNVKNKEHILKSVSYNYNRTESNLTYQDISNIKNVNVSDSLTNVFNTIKSDAKVNALWKWFVIFALVFLVIEMLILKYFK